MSATEVTIIKKSNMYFIDHSFRSIVEMLIDILTFSTWFIHQCLNLINKPELFMTNADNICYFSNIRNLLKYC